MTFAVPAALFGLLAAGVPLLLHLFARREPPTVVFPTTRYLTETAREHQRRFHLQHWLLLAIRTLLIVALVLAAAGPSWPSGGIGTHAPGALVLIVDNSLSSGVVRSGIPVLDELKAAARAVVGQATPDDRLWLMASDGLPRRGDRASLGRAIDSLVAEPVRLDLGRAVTTARELLAGEPRVREVVVVTDLQRTALTAASAGPIPVTVLRPDDGPVQNAGLARLDAGAQPWGPDGGAATITVAGTGREPAPVTITLGNRPPRQLLVLPGGSVVQRLPSPAAGWWTLGANLDPDELRLDNARVTALRVAPAARVRWRPDDHYVAAAADVLSHGGRIGTGDEVTLGGFGPRASVILPPADPAQLGAQNRTLDAKGSEWRFGDLDLTPTATDSSAWLGRERIVRRYRLVSKSTAPRGVLVTAAGAPWLVRSGDILLLGSRLEPDWTGLPLSARFVPFLDALVNRAARGEVALLETSPGESVLMPDRVTAVAEGQRRWTVEGGAGFRPLAAGVYMLMAEGDTIGALSVNPDLRESDLTRAPDGLVTRLWKPAQVAPVDRARAVAFQANTRSDLRGPLLWAALVLGLAEVALATRRRPAR